MENPDQRGPPHRGPPGGRDACLAKASGPGQEPSSLGRAREAPSPGGEGGQKPSRRRREALGRRLMRVILLLRLQMTDGRKGSTQRGAAPVSFLVTSSAGGHLCCRNKVTDRVRKAVVGRPAHRPPEAGRRPAAAPSSLGAGSVVVSCRVRNPARYLLLMWKLKQLLLSGPTSPWKSAVQF